MAAVSTIYVTGHRNPDTDSIASAIGYAELKGRLDPRNHYVPVRLGDVNAQTRWVLERAGAREPEFLPHIMLRVQDVMRESFPSASHREPIRGVGQAMAREDLELMPIVDDDGALAGVMTERTLARRYIRESREPTSLSDAAASVAAIVEVTEGRLVAGEEREIAGRVWVLAMAVESLPGEIGDGRRRRGRRPRPTPSAARSSSASRCWSPATARCPPTRCSRSPASAARPSSPRRWTAT